MGSELLIIVTRAAQKGFRCDSEAKVQFLREQKIPFDVQDEHGRISLFDAVQMGHYEVAKLLLEAGANPNTTERGALAPIPYDAKGPLRFRNQPDKVATHTPLFFAAGTGDDRMVELLLSHSAEPDHENKYGETDNVGCWERI
ncbi:ankyrin [Aspergillus costaricaensis CBS 115574]|uniref:Ankyrin n=1 Tax=Aspergillus costaricaensis CBS 115574 TaxID=1448317 RepID=A0ACD1IE83_9EURO|nr:ankyrin [Aspergillus costaricaensis CBS 115574]RAK88087.1 ankyrin [Aspergillus costaricaensis CBS 115574]